LKEKEAARRLRNPSLDQENTLVVVLNQLRDACDRATVWQGEMRGVAISIQEVLKKIRRERKRFGTRTASSANAGNVRLHGWGESRAFDGRNSQRGRLDSTVSAFFPVGLGSSASGDCTGEELAISVSAWSDTTECG
jgi:hypothetical protein